MGQTCFINLFSELHLMENDPLPAKVAKVYFEGNQQKDVLDTIYAVKNIHFGGWRADEKGNHLRLIIVGDLPNGYLTTFAGVKEVIYEAPWPAIPEPSAAAPAKPKSAGTF
jgi:hypothetical protein